MDCNVATQNTDLDRADNIAPVVKAAGPTDAPNADLLVRARKGDDVAQMSVIARHEARVRKLVTRANVGAAPVPDLQQSAMLGVLRAVRADNGNGRAEFFTFAHSFIVEETREANRTSAPKPAERHAESYYWQAMKAADGDARTARHYSGLMRLSINELEPLADAGDMLAREIVDSRLDRYDSSVRRDPEGAPKWDEYSARTGRGLDGATFDAIHSAVSYLDAAAETEDGEAGTLHDTVADESGEAGYRNVENEMTARALLAELDDRGAEILARAFGIDRPRETQREIASALGLSRPRVANIITSCLKILRATSEI
ncbi:sigma-70 family RNA polymerase sigma factor [Actinomadura fulvescens]|uniref:RNA polymerase sigma-70 region 4 domain-containing protein n=1 Tax=Actinomadura fulvescens TaxID=46160 RepID=A0ABN3Q1R9_9ACTN